MRFLLAVSIVALVTTLPAVAAAEDYMKYMKPYEESPADLDTAKLLSSIDQAVAANDKTTYEVGLAKLRGKKPRKNIENLLRSQDPMRRALAVMGHRLLPIKRAWDDLRFMLMDSNPMVRWQVMLYAAAEPQGIDLDGIKMSLSDPHPEVRGAAVFAVLKVARKNEQAIELFRMRWKEEKDPAVKQKLRTGFTLLGVPSPASP